MDTPRIQCDICRRWTDVPADGIRAAICLDCRVDLELAIEHLLAEVVADE